MTAPDGIGKWRRTHRQALARCGMVAWHSPRERNGEGISVTSSPSRARLQHAVEERIRRNQPPCGLTVASAQDRRCSPPQIVLATERRAFRCATADASGPQEWRGWNERARMVDAATSRGRARPITSDPLSCRMNESSAIRDRSISAAGAASLCFIVGISVCPPAMYFASAVLANRASASARFVARKYRKGAVYTD